MRARRTTTYTLILILLLLAGAVAWAGCGGPTKAAASSVLAGKEPFVASAITKEQTDGTSTKVGDVTQVRNATVSYIIDATDPRVTGTFEVVFDYDEAADGSGNLWGTWKSTSEKGTWVCDTATGSWDAKGHTFTFGVGTGTGAYEGLYSIWQWYWPLNTTSFSTALPFIAVSGWIQKTK